MSHDTSSDQVLAFPGDWGSWCLGDLLDALQRVVGAVGPSAPASWLSVYAPTISDDLPWVQVSVDDRNALNRIRSRLDSSAFLPFYGHETRSSFQAEANEVAMHFWSPEAGEP